MAKVEIIVDAIDKATGELKGINQQLDRLDDNVKQIDRTVGRSNPFKTITSSWTEFSSAYNVVSGLITSAVNTWDQAAAGVTNYAYRPLDLKRWPSWYHSSAVRLSLPAPSLVIPRETLSLASGLAVIPEAG